MKKWLFFVIPIIVVLALELLYITDFWYNFESRAKDTFFNLRGSRAVSGKVVIVAIDDASFDSFKTRWPFPRSYFAHLIDNLEKAGASQIIFDIEFTEHSDAAEDSILAQTASKYKNIIFSGKVIEDSQTGFEKKQVLPPLSMLTETGNSWGIVNIFADNDGFVRTYNLYKKYQTDFIYSIGVKSVNAAQVGSNINNIMDKRKTCRIGAITIPKLSRTTCLINYYGPAKTFPTYSIADVIDDSSFTMPDFDVDTFYDLLKEKRFKDKIVLIGSTADELHDNFNTPFIGKQMTPGVEIHANFIEMALYRNFLFTWPYFLYFLILVAFALLFNMLNSFIKPNISLAITLATIAVIITITYYLFSTQNLVLPVLELPLVLIVLWVVSLISHYLKTAKEKKFIKEAFQHYMSSELVNELIKDPSKLSYGGAQKEITILMSDIRAFTTYTEMYEPKEVVQNLKEYLTAMVDIIIHNKGTLDKFIGDAVMALFGSPVDIGNDALVACKVALEMRRRVDEMMGRWTREGRVPFEIGIGVNTGTVTVGNLGSEQIFDYTAIGDTVNLSARLESLNKDYPTKNKIIISETTYLKAKDFLEVAYLGEVLVKGKHNAVKIYELLDVKSE